MTEGTARTAAAGRRTARRRRLSTLAALTAVVGLAAGCIAPYTGNPSGLKVAVIGDSITGQAAGAYQARLAPTYQVSVDGRPGYTIAQQYDTAVEYAATKPGIVVIALGTNDDTQAIKDLSESPTNAELRSTIRQQTRDDLLKMIDAFTGRPCFVLVNVVTDVLDPVFRAWAEIYNSALLQGASNHPDRARVADWAGFVLAYDAHDDPTTTADDLTTDTVHVTELGAAKLADLVGAQVDACASIR